MNIIEQIANEILNNQLLENEKIYIGKVENGIFYANIDSSRRGTGSVIIGEDSTFLYGDSNIGASQLLERFKNGERTNYELNCIKQNKVESYMDDFINQPLPEQTELDKEFDKYCELYKEKFGKNAYVAEPSGTKEKTITAIKECLEKNEDILDKLLYPNFEDDMNNGSLY